MFLKYKDKRYGLAEKTSFKEFEEFDCIIKKNDSISCFKNNKLVLKLSGIKDIKNYSVESGNFTIEKNKEEFQSEINAKLLKDSANLQIQLDKQRELNANLLIKIAQIGGNVNA